MNRRSFLSLMPGAVAGSALASPSQSETQPSPLRFTRAAASPFHADAAGRPPHLLLLSADMVGPDMYHPTRPLAQQVRLPNIRSLMEDGTFFENAFCTVPLCAPSRASYLTGRYSYIQGNSERAPDGLQFELRPDDTIFPEYLKAAGYLTRQVGKCHVGTKKFLDAFGENDQPWDRWSPPVFDDDDFLAYQRRLGVTPQKYAREIVFQQQDRKTPGNSAGGWIVQQDGRPFPKEAQYSFYLGHKIVDTLEGLHADGSLTRHPSYLQLDIFDPHQPFSIPAGYEQRERELRALMTLPASYQAAQQRNFEPAPDEPEIVNLYRKYWGIYDPQTLIDYRVANILQMELVDEVIGRVLAKYKELGLYDNTLIAFISDHGEMNGRRAMVDKGVYVYPDVLRVPMVLKPPRSMPRTQASVAAPVSLMDISQTFLDAAGIQAEAHFDGISLLPHLRSGADDEERTLLFFGGWHVGVNFACGTQHRYADGRRYLYAYNASSPKDELYDLDSDDAVNLIDSPAHAEVRRHMIRRLGAALQADPRWVGYWSEFRIARFKDLPTAAGDMQIFTGPA